MAGVIFTKQTQDGRQVEVADPRRYLHGYVADVYLAGQRIGRNESVMPLLPEQTAQFPGYTHRIGKVVLTASEAATVEAALQARAEADPEVQSLRLRSERDMLVRATNALMDEQGAKREEHYDSGAVGPVPAYETAEVREAQEALSSFDAAHPEVVEAIKREKADQAARNQWN